MFTRVRANERCINKQILAESTKIFYVCEPHPNFFFIEDYTWKFGADPYICSGSPCFKSIIA